MRRIALTGGIATGKSFAFETTLGGEGVDLGDSTSVTVSPTEDTQFVPSSSVVGCGAFAGIATATGKALTPTIQR